NNPLVGVVNIAQLAARNAEDPVKVRAALEEIRQAGLSCSSFVKRMLAFTKARQFERRPHHLDDVIGDAVALFRQSSGRHVDVAVDLAGG
ncbi:hypothetical protein J8J27_28345, partial [Mycobacterium tuberculosis]|nr:hypothetical protein [Mycobacterium tuberculosis]